MDPRQALASLPRAPLGQWPTPLHRLDRFGEAIGVEVWMKRDDIGSPGLAGNKVRKYELVLGQAQVDGADVLVTTGAAQSNSARTGAAAAASLGMDCVLVLSGEAPDQPTANLLLDTLVGAELEFAGDVAWARLNERVDEVAEELRAAGRSPVVGPVGCSSPLGSLGFALAALELADQLDNFGVEPESVYTTSTSGGTAAGLVVGAELLGRPWPIRAVDAGLVTADPAAAIATLSAAAGALIGLPVTGPELDVDLGQVGPGYGAPTAAANEAIGLLARSEGVFVDPVYSAKGLAGLIADARAGAISGPVVFWHTGGWHALFAH